MEQQLIGDYLKEYYPYLERPLRDEIVQAGKVYTFKAKELIQDYGSYFRMVPLLIKGSIKVLTQGARGQELLLYYLLPGSSCSMSFSCCMARKQSAIRTAAEEDTIVIGVPIEKVDEWMSKFPSWKGFVMDSYDSRIRELVETIDEIAFQKLDDRLLNYLERRKKAVGGTTLNTTHQEIAFDLNVSREAISRMLKKLESMGQVVLGRNKVEVL